MSENHNRMLISTQFSSKAATKQQLMESMIPASIGSQKSIMLKPEDPDDVLSISYANDKQKEKERLDGETSLFSNEFIVELSEKRQNAIYMEGEKLMETNFDEIVKLNQLLEHIKYSWLNLPVDPRDITAFPEVCITCGTVFNGKAELTHFLHRLGFTYQVIFNRLGVVGTHSFFPCCRNELMNILPKEDMPIDYELLRGLKDLSIAEQEANERNAITNYTYGMLQRDKAEQEKSAPIPSDEIVYMDVGCGLFVPVIKGTKLNLT